MAPRPLRLFFGAFRVCGRLLLWSLWLVLAAALVFQLRILQDGGLRVPRPLLTLLDRPLAAEGLALHVGDVWLDPRGRVLVRDARLGLAGQTDAFASVDTLTLQLRRRELLHRRLVPTGLEISGGRLALPAPLSPSGVVEDLLTGGEFRLALAPGAETWSLTQASARVLGVPTSFAGAPPAFAPGPVPDRRPPAAENVRAALVRAAGLYPSLAALPLDSIRSLRIDLAPAGLIVAAETPALIAPAHPARPPALVGTTLERVYLAFTLHFPATGLAGTESATIRLDAERFAAPAALALTGRQLSLRVQPVTPAVYAADLAVAGLEKTDLAIPAVPLVAAVRYSRDPTSPRLEGTISTRLADAPWSLAIAGDPVARSGTVGANGAITPALLEIALPFIPARARGLFTLADPIDLTAAATLAPGARPDRANLRFTTGRANAHGVAWDRASADLVYDAAARRLVADPARMVLADCGASGTYEMDVDTLAYRFLLAGSLRPMLIEGWFTEWWDQLWANFTFGARPPEAEIDILGVWGQPDRSDVFIGVHSGPMALRALPIDSLDTRIRTHDHRVEVHGLRAVTAGRSATGTFTRVYNPVLDGWSRMVFDIRSDLPVESIPLVFPVEGPALVEPLALTAPPDIHLVGELFGPGQPEKNNRQDYVLDVVADAPLRYRGFPLDHLALRVERRDRELWLENIRAGFAGGLAIGRATLTGPEEDRRIDLDVRLADAGLDLAITRWREFQATRPAPPAPAVATAHADPEKNRPLGGALALSLKAGGPLADPLGLSGIGEGEVLGADLARIRLLGGFSSLLSEIGIGLGTVRLTDAHARFDLDRNRLAFGSLRLTGPSALVEAKGDYLLDAGTLAFNARVHPFEQRSGLLSSTAGFVLSPLANVLEVELTGTLEEPGWTFTYGPTRLFRRMIGGDRPRPAPVPAPSANTP